MTINKGNLFVLISSFLISYGVIGTMWVDGVKFMELPFSEIIFLIGFVPLTIFIIKSFIWEKDDTKD